MALKQQLIDAITAAIAACRAEGSLPALPEGTAFPAVELETPRNLDHGDYSTNVALLLARSAREADRGRDFAEQIAAKLNASNDSPIASAEAAGGGFVNLRLKPGALGDALRQAITEASSYGRSQSGAGRNALVEFVSANPNGPITVAHGRGGAIGDVIATLLDWTGSTVTREFYVNDAVGSLQMRIFARSLFARYRQLFGQNDPVPEDGYPGEYVVDIARRIVEAVGDRYISLTPEAATPIFQDLALSGMREQQEQALATFGIRFDTWFSERTLHESGAVGRTLAELKDRGYAYREADALWLRSTAFGDDKDRVLVRADGSPTYLAGDLAYHADKFSRGFDLLVDVWGADHHGYIPRTRAGLAALGYDSDRLHIALFQLVRLIKDGIEVKMSKRFGNVLALEELVDEVGRDAARFFYLLRSSDVTLDFDMDLARRQEKENPVYYVQYAHARCCSMMVKASEAGLTPSADADMALLAQPEEITLQKKIADFPDEVRAAAEAYAPHRIARYTTELAALLHTWYDRGNRDRSLRVLVEGDEPLSRARLSLVQGVRITLFNALTLLGVSAPERMANLPDDAAQADV